MEQKRAPGAGENTAPPARLLLETSAGIIGLALLLFIPAGTLRWLAGWAYLALYAVWAYAGVLLLGRHSPELLVKRFLAVEPPCNNWDKFFFILFAPLIMTLIIICSSQTEVDRDFLSYSGAVSGFIGLACSYALFTVSLLNNNFAAPYVGLQAGQRPCDRGPYAVIRHPMYLALICFFGCTPAALGSFAGFAPGALLALLVAARTAAEDRFLLKNLPGYSGYAARVRYRLVPGVW